ncbi:TerB N-terminal domain-containing protein [Mesorhizobium sp. Root172]|uniref:tellurite resistance TerB family protein n=1 Tax=Mesorhizobium sp. Root172 TaxID=1736481 RepID=UPI0009EA0786|nr:TerB N-terminal domain-containing protein [Mesorhizobium sp. Root172]
MPREGNDKASSEVGCWKRLNARQRICAGSPDYAIIQGDIQSKPGATMVWVLAGAALAAWFIYRAIKNKKRNVQPPPLRDVAQTRSNVIETLSEVSARKAWVDPRINPDPRFTEGPDQRDRGLLTPSPPNRDRLSTTTRSSVVEDLSEVPSRNAWIDPRNNPDPRFTEGSDQWDRQRAAPSPPISGRFSPVESLARWIPRGESVRVSGISIDAGMFYLGGAFAGSSSGRGDNCLVDPSCTVAPSGSDLSGGLLPYWPSYSNIPPIARRTYLDWLAGGRNDPRIGIGYVFLFFYGLERRLFVDAAKEEAPALIAEVRRLLTLHGDNHSFKNYALKLLDVAELVKGPEISRPALSPDFRNGYEMPLSVRLHLGRKLSSAASFDGTDALLWVLSLPDNYLRTPATRCFEELVELWQMRFASRYPQGLKVNPPKTKLKIEYHGASGGFDCRLDLSDSETGPLPDIAAISAPLEGLRDLLNACTDELASYSRLLGKSPEAKGTIEAAFLLPKEMLTSPSVMGSAVLERVEHLFGGRNIAGVRVGQLAKALGVETPPKGKLPSGFCNQVGAFMDKLDVGLEPDRRYGARNLDADGYVLLFKAKDGAPVDSEAPSYASARAMVEVAALAAASDGKIETSEFESIKSDIRAVPGLGGIERARLMAYASTLLKDAPARQSAMQRLRSVRAEARDSAIRSATSAVLADGHAAPDEVKFLERLYKTLGYPVEDLYSALHRGSVVLDEPIVVTPEIRTGSVPIPAEASEPKASGIRIDRARLERIKSETSAVSQLLAGIFVEDELLSSPPAPMEATLRRDSRFEGLDAAHAELLSCLLGAGELDRDAFEDMARKLRLLPDGAIETINEWGFDKFDEPILDGEEHIVVVEHVRMELQRAGAER